MHAPSTESLSTVKFSISRFSAQQIIEVDDFVAVEEPLEIQLFFKQEQVPILKSISVTMRTPGHDRHLAVGFLYTEGIVECPEDIKTVAHQLGEENKIRVTMQPHVNPNLPTTDRNFYTTSSCGVCGKSSIEAIHTQTKFQDSEALLEVNYQVLLTLPQLLQTHQNVFKRTGGLHASALFDLQGRFISLGEDVGRHNALDKLIGEQFLANQLPLQQHVLLMSGRASFELLQKSWMAGIKIVLAIGAPSSLAITLAQEKGITLIGFLKADRFNIYTHPQRITGI
jgi:FdhD protein